MVRRLLYKAGAALWEHSQCEMDWNGISSGVPMSNFRSEKRGHFTVPCDGRQDQGLEGRHEKPVLTNKPVAEGTLTTGLLIPEIAARSLWQPQPLHFLKPKAKALRPDTRIGPSNAAMIRMEICHATQARVSL